LRKLSGRPRCAVAISTRLASPDDPLTVLETDLESSRVVARKGPRLIQFMRHPAGPAEAATDGLSAAVALRVVGSMWSRALGISTATLIHIASPVAETQVSRRFRREICVAAQKEVSDMTGPEPVLPLRRTWRRRFPATFLEKCISLFIFTLTLSRQNDSSFRSRLCATTHRV
jgi:hypothetical protein